jgi:hypothetical protein
MHFRFNPKPEPKPQVAASVFFLSGVGAELHQNNAAPRGGFILLFFFSEGGDE